MRPAILATFTLSRASPCQAQTAPDFSGVWWNERCSKMEFVKSADQIAGSYTSALGKSAGTPFPLIGYQIGDLIAFTVNFGATGALTSWAGQNTVERGVEKFVTMWHLAANIPDSDEEQVLFSTVWTGSDVFVRAKPGHCP